MSYSYSLVCNHVDTDENYPEVLSITFIENVNRLSYKISGYFKVPRLKRDSNFKKSIFEMLEKNLHLINSINFKQDANLKHTHSKSFVKFLNQKVKDNSDSILSKLNLSEFVSSAQTELELPSSSQNALTLYNAVLNSVDWWTDLLNLFIDFVNQLSEYNQNSKIDRLLECNFDAKKFNRLLGDALNYAREYDGQEGRENFEVVKRNDKQYVDESPDGMVSLDWDGGLPAIYNHRHYDFSSFLSFPVYIAGQAESGKEWISRYIVNSFYHDHWSGGEIFGR